MIKKRLSYEDWQHIYSKGSRFGCSSALTYKGLKDSVKICLKNLDFEVDFSRKGFSEIIKNAIDDGYLYVSPHFNDKKCYCISKST